jgi:hypothetical protein
MIMIHVICIIVLLVVNVWLWFKNHRLEKQLTQKNNNDDWNLWLSAWSYLIYLSDGCLWSETHYQVAVRLANESFIEWHKTLENKDDLT